MRLTHTLVLCSVLFTCMPASAGPPQLRRRAVKVQEASGVVVAAREAGVRLKDAAGGLCDYLLPERRDRLGRRVRDVGILTQLRQLRAGESVEVEFYIESGARWIAVMRSPTELQRVHADLQAVRKHLRRAAGRLERLQAGAKRQWKRGDQ